MNKRIYISEAKTNCYVSFAVAKCMLQCLVTRVATAFFFQRYQVCCEYKIL